MKNTLKRLIALLLAAGMLLPAMACAKGNDDQTPDDTANGTGAVTEADTSDMPPIEKTDYDEEFVFLNCSSILDDELFWVDETKRGDPMSDSVYERALNIKEHLGVTLTLEKEKDDYASDVRTMVQAGEDAYQLVLSHGTTGAGSMVSSNVLYDFTNFSDVNLDAPYWNREIMDMARIGDRYLLGYGDFSLSHVHCLIFNKDMMKEYNMSEPYSLVDDQKWTLDTFIGMASTVAKDNGDGLWTDQDTYGLTGWCGSYMTSFVIGCGLNVVARDETDTYYLAYTEQQEKLGNLTDKLITFCNSECAYLEGIGGRGAVDFTNGTTLFQFYDAADLAILRSSTVRFGVLPFPKWDEAQEDYRCLSMNGMMCVPSVIKNPAMVGQVLELLGYYTAPVKTAFYEDLLGSKLSEAPDDARMLDVIWDHQIFDPILIAYDAGSSMSGAFYLMQGQVSSGNNTLASTLKGMEKAANKMLKNFFNKKVR